MPALLSQLWFDDQAQDVAEYAIMLTIAIVLGAIARRPCQQCVFISRKCDPVKGVVSGRSAKSLATESRAAG